LRYSDQPYRSLTPHVSVLDTRRETPVWLVRVPQWLADLWSAQPADSELGAVEIKVGKDKEAHIYLKDYGRELPCKSFKLKKGNNPNPKPMKIFSEDTIGNVAVEGTVKYKFDLEPEQKATYQDALIKSASLLHVRNPNNKLPKIAVIDSFKQRDSKQFKNALTGGKRRRDEKGRPEKRERIDKDALVAMILDLFKDKDLLTLKEINDRCQQPEKYLKDVLNIYCKYNKKGTNKGMYELRDEYCPNKKPRPEGEDDDDDDD